MKKTILLAAFAVASAATSAQAQSWGFTLGNGAGFYWGNAPANRVYSAPAYIAPAPVYYERPVTYYQPQTVYMQPYQQMRPVYYPQTVVYRSEPVIVRESRRCNSRW
ncbi:MAG: hypothetical protein ACKOEZ_10015 [Spartobacteria bacterium]